VLSDIGFGEIFVIAVVGLLVFGPDRLPDMAKQAGGWVRDLRAMVASARSEMSDSLGVDAKYLNDPKGSLTKDLLGDDMPTMPTMPNKSDAVTKALGLDDVVEKPRVDGIDPDVT
jgi:Tat protein translocase TatB subunit